MCARRLMQVCPLRRCIRIRHMLLKNTPTKFALPLTVMLCCSLMKPNGFSKQKACRPFKRTSAPRLHSPC